MTTKPGAGLPDSASTQTSSTDKPTEKAKPLKKVVLEKFEGKRWSARFVGNVTRRDIAQLTRLIRVDYLRSKRKQRMDVRKAARTKEITDVSNG